MDSTFMIFRRDPKTGDPQIILGLPIGNLSPRPSLVSGLP